MDGLAIYTRLFVQISLSIYWAIQPSIFWFYNNIRSSLSKLFLNFWFARINVIISLNLITSFTIYNLLVLKIIQRNKLQTTFQVLKILKVEGGGIVNI